MEESAAAIFKALSDPTRLAVFQCIRCCGPACGYDTETGRCCGACDCDGGPENGVPACHIRCQVPCAPSTLTHHLNELRAAGLIETEKRGRVVYCRVLPEALAKIAAFVSGK
jgi:ArsR family transcriptional regulator